MENEEIFEKCDKIISEPLIDENGDINQKYLEELQSTIDSFPKTYDRLKDDPEWNIPIWLFFKDIIGHFAMWSIRFLKNTPYPLNLEKVIKFLHSGITKKILSLPIDRKSKGFALGDDMIKISLCEINKMLWDILEGHKDFEDWNTPEELGEDWIDLDALLHMVCISLRDEHRTSKKFSDDFDAEWKKNNPEAGEKACLSLKIN